MATLDPRTLLTPALEPGEQLVELGLGAARGVRRDAFSILAGAVVGAALVTALAWALRGWFGLGIHGLMIVAAVNLVALTLGGYFGPGPRAVVGLTERRVIARFMNGSTSSTGVACPRERARLERRSGNFLLTLETPDGPRVIGLPSWAEPNRKLAAALQPDAGRVR